MEREITDGELRASLSQLTRDELLDLQAFFLFKELFYDCSVEEWFEKYSRFPHGRRNNSPGNDGGAANAPADAQSPK